MPTLHIRVLNTLVPKSLEPNTSIVDALVQMFDESNNLVKIFRMSRDRFIECDIHRLRIRLIGSRTIDGREYNLPTCFEIIESLLAILVLIMHIVILLWN